MRGIRTCHQKLILQRNFARISRSKREINGHRRKFFQSHQRLLPRTEGLGKKLPPTPIKQSNAVFARKPASLPPTPGRQLPRMRTPTEDIPYDKSNFNEDYNYAYHSQDNLQQCFYSNENYVEPQFSQTDVSNVASDEQYVNTYDINMPNFYEQAYTKLQTEDAYKSIKVHTQKTGEQYQQPYLQARTHPYQDFNVESYQDMTYPKVSKTIPTLQYENIQDVVMQDAFHNASYEQNNFHQQSLQSDIEQHPYQQNQYPSAYLGQSYEENKHIEKYSDKNVKEINYPEKYLDNRYSGENFSENYQINQCQEKYINQIFQKSEFEEKHSDQYNQKQEKSQDQLFQCKSNLEKSIDHQYSSYSESISTNLYDQTIIKDEVNYNQYEENQCYNQYNNMRGTIYEELDKDKDENRIDSIDISQSCFEKPYDKKEDCSEYVLYNEEDEERADKDSYKNQNANYQEQYDSFYEAAYQSTFENNYNDSVNSSADKKIVGGPELSVTTPRGQTRLNGYSSCKLEYFNSQKSNQEIYTLGSERRKVISNRDIMPLIQRNTDSFESKDNELKDSFQIAVSSVGSSQLRIAFSECSTAGDSNLTPVMLTTSSQNHILPHTSVAKHVIHHVSGIASKKDTSINSNVTINGKRLTRTESYQVDIEEDDEFSEILAKEPERKDSQLSHLSHQSQQSQQSQISQQPSQQSQKPKLTRGESYASDNFPDDIYDRRDSYIETGRKDSYASITHDTFSKSTLGRTDSYQSKDHRGNSFNPNFSIPQPISRAESYQRGYFKDQQSIDQTGIVLGSAVNGEYKMTEETLERYLAK